MSASAPQSGRAHGIALAAFAVLALGLALAWQLSRPVRPPVPHPPVEGLTTPAPPATPFDSTEFKQRWVDEVRGVDLAGLDPPRAALFLRLANAGQCTCGCGYTLAGCRATDMTCDVSGERLGALLDSIRAGHITGARGTRERPRGGG